MILGGRGLRNAWQRALWAFIGVIAALVGGLLAVELVTRITG